MRRLLTACMIFFGAMTAAAENGSQTYGTANALYMQGRYADAAAAYESILKGGYESGELYYNLGNAYYKTGRIQNSILNYERAKRYFPHDEDLQVNLQMANLQVVDKIDIVPQLFIWRWIDEVLGLFSTQTWGWILYALFIVMLVSFSLFLLLSGYTERRASLAAGMVTALLFTIVLGIFIGQSYRDENTRFAIIMADVTNVKSAPDARGNDAFVLHRGVKVQVVDSVNQWWKIRLADGKVGWAPQPDCEVI
ncbi:MAG: tetratricopeptide repeat protein [Ignavibacteriales bacterium]|nr:tetratricopeptide repeat protein [Ignavibacteriales bacterium]